MNESANPVRIDTDAIQQLDDPRGPNAAEEALYAKIAELVNAADCDRLTVANACYGVMVQAVAGMPRHDRFGLVKHVLARFRSHVAKVAALQRNGGA